MGQKQCMSLKKNKIKKLNIVLLSFIAIVLIGSYLRLVGVFTNSFAFTYDVGRDMLALQQLVYHHKIPLIGFTTGVEGIFYGPWWYYILSIPFAVSFGNPQFIAFFMALTGIATIILMYVIGKKISDVCLGITLALLAAISPVLISLSNQIWNPNIAPLLIAISLFIILKILEKPTKLNLFLLGIFSGLLIDTEIVFGFLLLTSYVTGLFVILRKKLIIWQSLFYFLGLFIIFSPRIFFELRHQFLMTKTVIRIIAHIGGPDGSSLPLLVKESIFLNFFSDALAGSSQVIGLILLLCLVLLLVLFAKKTKGRERQIFIFSLITTAVFMLGISIFKHDIWPHYLVGLPMFYILASGILLNHLRSIAKYGKYLFIFSLLFIAWVNIKPISFISNLTQPIFIGDASVYRNQLAVVDYIYQKANGKPFTYIAYTPAVIDYPYQYLFSWYGPKIYHSSPSNNKEDLFFVIIEPDYENPSRIKDWLAVRKNDGKILYQQKMNSGILIQTRMH